MDKSKLLDNLQQQKKKQKRWVSFDKCKHTHSRLSSTTLNHEKEIDMNLQDFVWKIQYKTKIPVVEEISYKNNL